MKSGIKTKQLTLLQSLEQNLQHTFYEALTISPDPKEGHTLSAIWFKEKKTDPLICKRFDIWIKLEKEYLEEQTRQIWKALTQTHDKLYPQPYPWKSFEYREYYREPRKKKEKVPK